MKTITAIYEQGVLRLTQPIELPEGTEVQVVIITNDTNAPKGNAASILAAIAALPEETANSEVATIVDEI
jgi:predicted DNA-binding antitoxin AbrB/MazE fold protein